MAIVGAFVTPHPPLIFPEIGHGQQLKIQKTIDAYREISNRIATMKPDTIIVITPHSTIYRDYFHISPRNNAFGDFSQFGFPEIRIEAEYDTELAKKIEKTAHNYDIPAGFEGEIDKKLDHGTMIPLRFIREAFSKNFKIIRIGLSGLSLPIHYEFGKVIQKVCNQTDKRVVIVASSDLSHRLLDSGPYDFAKEGPEYDEKITRVLGKGSLRDTLNFTEDFCDKAGECGHRSITIMAGCLDGITLQSELLSYEGPFGVGYAVAAYQDIYVALARASLEASVKNGTKISVPLNTPKELLEQKAGAFVTLEKLGRLRGCIGTIQGVQNNIAEEVIENAVSAGLWDPRFPQVTEEELKDIICTVDVLSDPEPVNSLQELDVKKYGIIITKGRQRGLLLPNLEGVDTIEEQISITLSKAGIEAEDFNSGKCQLERFKVVRHY